MADRVGECKQAYQFLKVNTLFLQVQTANPNICPEKICWTHVLDKCQMSKYKKKIDIWPNYRPN